MVQIDGSHGEGGGQILRTSLSLSALTGEPLDIRNIRANRSQPGLRPQHLAAVKAVADITRGDLGGAEINSTRVQLIPEKVHGGDFQFNISTAGALTLVLQAVFLPLCFAGKTSEIIFSGGTHVRWSPTWHYIQECWWKMMSHLGFRGELTLERAGFYPRGGGKAKIKILPVKELQPLNCSERGKLIGIRGYSGVANLEESIAKRQKHQALRRLYEICRDSKIQTLVLPSPGKGTFILLKAEFSNCGCGCYSALGALGKPAEKVADEAVDDLLAFLKSDGCVDQFMADQLVLPLSIIPGESFFRTNRVTQHLLTNIHIIKQFLPVKITIDGELGEPALVKVHGISLLRDRSKGT